MIIIKISIDKNLAFSDQPEPVLSKKVADLIKPRKAIKPSDITQVDITRFIPTGDKPEIEAILDEKKNTVLRIKNFQIGTHVFPPKIKTEGVKSLDEKSKTISQPLVTKSFLPDHLPYLNPQPEPPMKGLDAPPFYIHNESRKGKKRGNQATTIFSPDNRHVFCDTSYPWGACGRVDSPNGVASGVMVGPRHLLTVSHTIQWNTDNSAGWVRFRPGYFAPSEPFGDAWASLVYWKYKVTGPTIDWKEGMYDYVVCVLDRRIGDLTGWLGTRGYTDSWDGHGYWTHVGYPVDVTGGNRPTYQDGISLDGAWWESDSHESMSHYGDVWPGQSGGPLFAWWSDGWPYAVAVQSSQNATENYASGGQDLVDLVIRARNEYP